jgi:hypothetical protein
MTMAKVRLIKRDRREPAGEGAADDGPRPQAPGEARETVGRWVDEFKQRGISAGVGKFESLFEKVVEERGAEVAGSQSEAHAPGAGSDAKPNVGGAGR